MKINHHATIFDRLRMIIGWLFAAAAGFILLVVNSIYGYNNTTVWLVGLGLLVLAVLISGSRAMIDYFAGINPWL
jgi:hypothetical protein